MKKVIVTGGAGYIGSHTVVELMNAGYEPVIFDNFSNSKPGVIDQINKITHQPITYFQLDCTDGDAMKQAIEKIAPVSGIIHFAAFKSVSESVAHPLKYYENNIGSSLQVLKMMETFGIPNLVFSSSCTVYGQPDQLPVTEKSPILKAQSPYGFTKQVGEQMIEDRISTDPGINSVILRYFNPVGAHHSSMIGELPIGKPDNLVPFITQTASGLRDELTIHGNDYQTPDGTCIRDYIHVMDVALAHVRALEWMESNPGNHLETFNIGIGKGASVQEVVDTFNNISGNLLKYIYGPRRLGDVEQIYANTDKAGLILDWEASFSLKEALIHAWKWQQSLVGDH